MVTICTTPTLPAASYAAIAVYIGICVGSWLLENNNSALVAMSFDIATCIVDLLATHYSYTTVVIGIPY